MLKDTIGGEYSVTAMIISVPAATPVGRVIRGTPAKLLPRSKSQLFVRLDVMGKLHTPCSHLNPGEHVEFGATEPHRHRPVESRPCAALGHICSQTAPDCHQLSGQGGEQGKLALRQPPGDETLRAGQSQRQPLPNPRHQREPLLNLASHLKVS